MSDEEIKKYDLSRIKEEYDPPDDPHLDLNYLRFKNHIKETPQEEE